MVHFHYPVCHFQLLRENIATIEARSGYDDTEIGVDKISQRCLVPVIVVSYMIFCKVNTSV